MSFGLGCFRPRRICRPTVWEGTFTRTGNGYLSNDLYDLGAVKVQSPFAGWLKYKLGSAIALQMAHDRRHLWQAREAVAALQRMIPVYGV